MLLATRMNQRRKLKSPIIAVGAIWSQNMRWSFVFMLEWFGVRTLLVHPLPAGNYCLAFLFDSYALQRNANGWKKCRKWSELLRRNARECCLVASFHPMLHFVHTTTSPRLQLLTSSRTHRIENGNCKRELDQLAASNFHLVGGNTWLKTSLMPRGGHGRTACGHACESMDEILKGPCLKRAWKWFRR